MTEFSAAQVELMRSEISDEEFLAWLCKRPGTIVHLSRPIFISYGTYHGEDLTLITYHGEDLTLIMEESHS